MVARMTSEANIHLDKWCLFIRGPSIGANNDEGRTVTARRSPVPSAPSPLKINNQRTDVKAKLSPVFFMSLDMNNEVKRLFQTLSLRFIFSITQILSTLYYSYIFYLKLSFFHTIYLKIGT
ncbi:hypothetical protein TM2_10420 [Bacillus altitudinis]|nr:hypothetical protein TM2_10420 [Bacillus altitudinis]